jgi:predicted nucleic-acid-binding Zn-ribbon protein
MKKLNTLTFIEKSVETHGDAYDYTESSFVDTRTKVSIRCRKHDLVFEQMPRNHFNLGHGCPTCGEEKKKSSLTKTTCQFLEEVALVHGGTYDYTNSKYEGSNTKIKVLCRVDGHGEFSVTPKCHITSKSGCPKCKATNTSKRMKEKYTNGEFIKKATVVHGERYDYSLVEYKNATSEVSILCKEHGKFEQKPMTHLQGCGCSVCADMLKGQYIKLNTEAFIEKATAVHGGLYEYNDSDYIGSKDQILITCKVHGEFSQLPNGHLSGRGCPKCGIINPSKGQVAVTEFIKKLGFNVVTDTRMKDSRLELDILVPEKNVGIEFDGIYWHSSKFRDDSYHLRKQKVANNNGIRLIQIFSDEWEQRRPAVEATIRHVLGVTEIKVGARKFKSTVIDKSLADEFYNVNHVQGKTNRGTNYALVDSVGNPVAVATFSTSVSTRGQEIDVRKWELVRFATNASIVGAASKLMSAFLKATPECESIISFSDPRWFSGEMYSAIGFTKVAVNPPSYSYVKQHNAVRHRKVAFQRKYLPKLLGEKFDPLKTERENCEAAGYYQIYDCGLVKWLWQRT